MNLNLKLTSDHTFHGELIKESECTVAARE